MNLCALIIEYHVYTNAIHISFSQVFQKFFILDMYTGVNQAKLGKILNYIMRYRI